MAIDTSLLPALEAELHSAKQVTGGGQPPRPERIAAIEEQIKLTLEALGKTVKKIEKGVKAEVKALEARGRSLETADATPPVENADESKPS